MPRALTAAVAFVGVLLIAPPATAASADITLAHANNVNNEGRTVVDVRTSSRRLSGSNVFAVAGAAARTVRCERCNTVAVVFQVNEAAAATQVTTRNEARALQADAIASANTAASYVIVIRGSLTEGQRQRIKAVQDDVRQLARSKAADPAALVAGLDASVGSVVSIANEAPAQGAGTMRLSSSATTVDVDRAVQTS